MWPAARGPRLVGRPTPSLQLDGVCARRRTSPHRSATAARTAAGRAENAITRRRRVAARRRKGTAFPHSQCRDPALCAGLTLGGCASSLAPHCWRQQKSKTPDDPRNELNGPAIGRAPSEQRIGRAPAPPRGRTAGSGWPRRRPRLAQVRGPHDGGGPARVGGRDAAAASLRGGHRRRPPGDRASLVVHVMAWGDCAASGQPANARVRDCAATTGRGGAGRGGEERGPRGGGEGGCSHRDPGCGGLPRSCGRRQTSRLPAVPTQEPYEVMTARR